ncbi:hypothetical protein AKO1_006631 [Acrasis kona]|uniref:Uncharacterized protein n=1 Tax=Acrasis kona TaxID=1008807 RepID=A0AAW2Z631_9EUKA
MDVEKDNFDKQIYKTVPESNVAHHLIKRLFEYNSKSKKSKFVLAGGFVLKSLTQEYFDNEYYGPGTRSDIDVFLMEYGDDIEHNDKILKDILKSLDEIKIENDFMVAMYSNTINIISNGGYDVQIVLRRIHSIEELLVLFDLDCCRFAYDGTTVYTINEGMRAYKTKKNYVPADLLDNEMYYRRATKYGHRGYTTLFLDVGLLDHLSNPNIMIKPTEAIKTDERYISENDPWELAELSEEDLEEVCYNRNTSRPYDDDSEFYTSLNRMEYSDFVAYYKGGIKKLKKNLPSHEDGLMMFPEKSFIEHITKIDFVITRRFGELFETNASKLFIEYYRDVHLAKKYLISRCYLCGRYSQKSSNEECVERCHAFCADCKRIEQDYCKQTRDLTGHVAIVTGARIKIGFEVCLRLLRAGCKVIATTRFVSDALDRFKEKGDYDQFKNLLLEIYPLDLRNGLAVNTFCEYITKKYPRISILINNAAQTVKRENQFYKKELKKEEKSIKKGLDEERKELLSGHLNYLNSYMIPKKALKQETKLAIKNQPKKKKKKQESDEDISDSSLPFSDDEVSQSSLKSDSDQDKDEEVDQDDEDKDEHYPDEVDRFGVQVDNRENHTWNTKLNNVQDQEVIEVQAINNISPTLLVSKLQPLMKVDKNSQPKRSYIINVTSHEGQFNTTGKTDFHAHTNMSKAALNMLTRTLASEYARNGIIMNSVDTGWVSSAIKTFREAPLDADNGAARVLFPIIKNNDEYGVLYKNYKPANW